MIKVLVGTPSNGGSSGGDMTKAVYDPQDINADAFDRSNHTGEQAISTVTGLPDELGEKLQQGDNTLTEDLEFNRTGSTKESTFLFDDREIVLTTSEQSTGNNGEVFIDDKEIDLVLSIGGLESQLIINNLNGLQLKEQILGKGIKFQDRTVDEANVDFETDNDNLLSIGKAKENLTKKALTQTSVNSTPKVISSTDSDTTFNVYGVGALCVFTINTGSLNVGEAFEINIGDSDGVDIVGSGVNIFGAITGSTTVGDSVLVRRISDDSFGLIGEVYKVY